jgi:hypothetical protein
MNPLRWVVLLHRLERSLQFILGFLPATGRDEDAAIDHSTIVKDRRAVVAFGELVYHLTPLERASEVGGAIAGRKHVAARIAHDEKASRFPSRRGSYGFVQDRHAFVDLAQRDESAPLFGQRP